MIPFLLLCILCVLLGTLIVVAVLWVLAVLAAVKPLTVADMDAAAGVVAIREGRDEF